MAVNTGSKKGPNVANIRSPIYPEMGTFKGRGHKDGRSTSHMKWGSGRKGSSR